MDAGGLAQMTYNNFPSNNFGPTNSFSSRGKGNHIKKLSVAPPNGMGAINENEVDNTPAPRTSRAHMLSGLRTAPRVNTAQAPASAPHSQTRFGNDFHSARNPRDAMGGYSSQAQSQYNQGHDSQSQMLLAEQIMAPTLNLGQEDISQLDPAMAQQMYFLAQRQQQLQAQLMNVQAAAQQFQGMNLGANQLSPSSSMYNQQVQSGLQPVVSPVPGQMGFYSVYNPMSGQSNIVHESTLLQQQQQQQMQLQNMPQSPMASGFSQAENHSVLRRDNASPPSATANVWARTGSPPRKTPSPPQDVAPLPEPSATAYRPGHRRSMSSLNKSVDIGKSGPRSAGMPPTPTNGTFGLGLARAGEHPMRQPRGPPAIEELVAAPTSKHEGSKNFATRQRRKALFSLVRAGNERRVGGRPNSPAGDVSTPGSEKETPFSLGSSDNDSDITPATGSLSAHSSFGSLRAAAGGAIGSEVKSLKERSRERDTFARRLTGDSNSSGEENANGNNNNNTERRRTPMLVLTSAEKRKSTMGNFSAFSS